MRHLPGTCIPCLTNTYTLLATMLSLFMMYSVMSSCIHNVVALRILAEHNAFDIQVQNVVAMIVSAQLRVQYSKIDFIRDGRRKSELHVVYASWIQAGEYILLLQMLQKYFKVITNTCGILQ